MYKPHSRCVAFAKIARRYDENASKAPEEASADRNTRRIDVSSVGSLSLPVALAQLIERSIAAPFYYLQIERQDHIADARTDGEDRIESEHRRTDRRAREASTELRSFLLCGTTVSAFPRAPRITALLLDTSIPSLESLFESSRSRIDRTSCWLCRGNDIYVRGSEYATAEERRQRERLKTDFDNARPCNV